MINKYTLIFKDSILENAFQQYMDTEIRRPLLQKLIISSTMLLVISFIQKMLDQSLIDKPSGLILIAIRLLMEVFFFIIYKYKQQYLKQALLLYNHIMVFIYITMDNQTVQQQLVYTIGILVIQIVNILFGEFREAVYQTITFCSIYLFFAFLNDHQIDYNLISLILASIIILISAFYQNIKALRSQFQLGKIDNQWEQIFKSQIEKDEYMVLYYDANSYSFSLNQQFKIQNLSNNQELREFLRNIKNNKHTLEQEIFIKIQENKLQTNIINQELEMYLLNNQKTKIKCSIFFGFNIIILLKFVEQFQLEKLKEQNIEQLYQSRYKLLMNRIIKFVKSIRVQQNMIQQACQLRKYCLYTHLKDFLTKETNQSGKYITKINFIKIKAQLQMLYQNKRIQFQNIANIECKGSKQLILIILIEIIEITLSQSVFIRLEQGFNESFVIQVFCDYNEKCSYLLNKRVLTYFPFLFNVQFHVQSISVTFQSFSNLEQFEQYRSEYRKKLSHAV